MPNFMFSDFYLSLSFNFKIGLSLGLSYLMSFMFVIILIICIIKKTFFNNTILMAELKIKVHQSRWSLSAHNFPIFGYFHKIFGMHLQKGSVHFYTQKFLHVLLYFWNYNPSPNRQIMSLIDALAHF